MKCYRLISPDDSSLGGLPISTSGLQPEFQQVFWFRIVTQNSPVDADDVMQSLRGRVKVGGHFMSGYISVIA